MDPVAANVCVDGVYTSAEESSVPEVFSPPAIRTVPFVRSVAVWLARAVVIFPTRVNVWLKGL
jgi:hypothetical protein